jgi:hypothetical protein
VTVRNPFRDGAEVPGACEHFAKRIEFLLLLFFTDKEKKEKTHYKGFNNE